MERITIYQGDTPTFNFTVTEDDVGMDLTNATVRFSAKAKYDSTTYQFNKTDPVSKDSSGNCSFLLSAANTNTPGIFYAELETNIGGVIHTPVQFILEIREHVGSAS